MKLNNDTITIEERELHEIRYALHDDKSTDESIILDLGIMIPESSATALAAVVCSYYGMDYILKNIVPALKSGGSCDTPDYEVRTLMEDIGEAREFYRRGRPGSPDFYERVLVALNRFIPINLGD